MTFLTCCTLISPRNPFWRIGSCKISNQNTKNLVGLTSGPARSLHQGLSMRSLCAYPSSSLHLSSFLQFLGFDSPLVFHCSLLFSIAKRKCKIEINSRCISRFLLYVFQQTALSLNPFSMHPFLCSLLQMMSKDIANISRFTILFSFC